jgi:hypothetical protein
MTGLAGTVSVDGWTPTTVSSSSVEPGSTVRLPVDLRVPKRSDPGARDASYSLTFTIGGDRLTLTGSTEGWATVTSGLEVGDVTAALGAGDPAEHATLSVPVANTGAADVRGHVEVDLPDGWHPVPSPDVSLPAGRTTVVEVPVVVPLDVVAGSTPVSVSVVRGSTTLASKDTTVSFDLPTPPAADVVDHVDFGDGPSESAHAIQADPHSGTNTEAGYTRRYAHSSFPGSWYSVQVDVPVEAPFILRGIETFDGARTKKYHVYVDDQLVRTQLVPRTESGSGIKVYDALVDDPAVFSSDGNVRVKFEYPTDASGFFDPSIADLWVLGVPADTQAPDVSAFVTDATPGDNGWYRSDAVVSVAAADNRDDGPRVQVGQDAGWQDYTGPVTVAGEGKHSLSYRATDGAGNTSGTRSLPVWIDATAPATTLRVEHGSGDPDRATLGFAAQDALSGVATTAYRIDGGDWQVLGAVDVTVSGFGDHTVEYSSTDVAGNAEVVHRSVVTLTDTRIAAVQRPTVSGEAKVGRMLTSTTGSWNTTGLTFTRQWLRDGRSIKGATGVQYRLTGADLGKRIAVLVTASKPGLPTGTATSEATAAVTAAHP